MSTLTAIKDLSTLSTTLLSPTKLQSADLNTKLLLDAPLKTTDGGFTSLKQISTILIDASKTSTTTTTTTTTLVQKLSTEQTLSTTTISPTKTYSSTINKTFFLK